MREGGSKHGKGVKSCGAEARTASMGPQRGPHKVMMSMLSKNVALTKRYARTMVTMHSTMADPKRKRRTAAASPETARSSNKAAPRMAPQHFATKTKSMAMKSWDVAPATKRHTASAP